MSYFVEDAGERRSFDDFCHRLYEGRPLAYMAGVLSTWGKMAPGQGSYGKMLKIMANECARAEARALAAEAALARAEPLLAAAVAHNKTVTYGNPGGDLTSLVLASATYARAAQENK